MEDQPLIDRLFPQFRLSSFSGAIIRDTRDDPVDPARGDYVSANGQLAAQAIGSEVGFVKSFFTAQVFRVVPGTTRLVFAGNARLGSRPAFPGAFDALGQRLPDVANPRAAGRASASSPAATPRSAGSRSIALGTPGTRSLNDELLPIGGNGLVIFNAELRAPVRGRLGVVGFVDTGNVFATRDRHRPRPSCAARSAAASATSRRSGRSGSTSGSRSIGSRVSGSTAWFVSVRTGVLMRRQRSDAGARMMQDARCVVELRAARLDRAVARCWSGAVRAETIDRVLAVVAGQLITLSDVQRRRSICDCSEPMAPRDPVRVVLTKLIDRELILAEVDRYAPPEPTAEAVDREVQRVRARFESQEALDAALARSGIDEKHLRETLRQDLRMRAYLDQRFTSAADRREAVIDDWLAGLRRRAEIVDLYLSRAVTVGRWSLSPDRRETARSAAGRTRRGSPSARPPIAGADRRLPRTRRARRSQSPRRRPASGDRRRTPTLVTTRPTVGAAQPHRRSGAAGTRAGSLRGRRPRRARPARTATRRAASAAVPAAGCWAPCAATARSAGRESSSTAPIASATKISGDRRGRSPGQRAAIRTARRADARRGRSASAR